MKNGIQKNTKVSKQIDFGRYSLLIVFGVLSAIVIQEKIGLEPFLGGILIATLLLIILYKDILRYKPSYLKNYNMLVLLGVMIVGTLLLGRFFEYVLISLAKGTGFIAIETTRFGIPIPAGAMLVTLLFDFHTAIVFSFVVSLLSGLWLNDSAYTVYVFVGSLTAAFSVIRCKRRSAILKGGFYVGVINTITANILLLFAGGFSTSNAAPSVIFALFSGVSVIAIVSVMLPMLEYIFKVTTDISLLELLDLEQPLMKNLMISAPGTYHHSVIVGNLVEAAAEAVGVNPLLARVSAYYHDIGKIKMPEYFVENQSGSLSRHDKLTPHMSSMIINSHVKEGVELARQYKIPEPIIDIIQQHHGSSLMTYFYQKAKEYGEDTPPEDEYKYPGPKPQTRVAALVMMADAVEAASRVLHDPTPARISALVDRIINHIFLEGQLDECELTLKDISEIKKHFTYILTGILHKRIDYPGFNFNGYTSKSKETPRHSDENIHREPARTIKDKSEEYRI
jgi:putative nucleotidyltransferase with HDIG domain